MLLWEFAVPFVPLAAAFPPVLWGDRDHLPTRPLLVLGLSFLHSLGLVAIIAATIQAGTGAFPGATDILKLLD